MTLTSFLPFLAASLSGALAVLVLIRDRRSFVHQIFAIGMIALAGEEILAAMSAQAVLPVKVLFWQRLRLAVEALLPGTWLLFSLTFARANYNEFVARWKWVIIAAFVVPLTLVGFFGEALFTGRPVLDESSAWLVRLGWSGYVFNIFLLLSTVIILMNLERTLRASTGVMRWQIKFMVLGLGGLFAVQIYTGSQTLLFFSVDASFEAIHSTALIVADILIFLSFVRARLLHVDVYLSQGFLYNSVTVMVVGVYLLAVGVLAKAVGYFGDSKALPRADFLVFLALLGLTTVLLSDELRQRVKRYLSRNFKRPQYDYRQVWATFAERTTSLVDEKNLCAAVASLVSETFGVSSVTIWCLDETRTLLKLSGSTLFSAAQEDEIRLVQTATALVHRATYDQPMPHDLHRSESSWVGDLKYSFPEYLRAAQVRYSVQLVAGRQQVGIMTLSDRVTKVPLSVEDMDLLKTIADQTAATLLKCRLSSELMRAKELEAFQTLSAFFVHDLKNLALTLSLTTRNLPAHFDNPEFRQDALRTISDGVHKINEMCSRLALLSKKPELRLVRTDLNQLVNTTLSSLNGSLKASPILRLNPLPELSIDPEQIQKVLVNLVLNANEAAGEGSEIEVRTERQNGWVVLSVSDNGCGMSKDFVAHRLFQPFQTTKNGGLGIGLFQSRRIVEALQGEIEVESEEGKGSTFRVMLPVKGSRV